MAELRFADRRLSDSATFVPDACRGRVSRDPGEAPGSR